MIFFVDEEWGRVGEVLTKQLMDNSNMIIGLKFSIKHPYVALYC